MFLNQVWDRGAAVAAHTCSAVACELKRSHVAGRRIDNVWIEEAPTILNLVKGRIVVPAKSNVHGELLADFPIILNIGRVRVVAAARLRYCLDGDGGVACSAQEIAGIGVAGAGCIQSATVRGKVGRGVWTIWNGEDTGGSKLAGYVVLKPLDLDAGRDGMIALEDLQIVHDGVGVGNRGLGSARGSVGGPGSGCDRPHRVRSEGSSWKLGGCLAGWEVGDAKVSGLESRDAIGEGGDGLRRSGQSRI